MGVKEVLANFGAKAKERKEKIRLLDEDIRMQMLVQERMKSANEREVDRFHKEAREESIKEELDGLRKQRRDDIAFGHNPLDTPNITGSTEWEVLKEKNMFGKKSSMFSNNDFIHKNNPNLLSSGKGMMR